MSSEISRVLLEASAIDLDTVQGFVYASGIKSPVYCDNRILLSYPDKREKIVNAFLALIKAKKLEFDAVAGVATAGIAWAAIIADKLKLPMVYVRASANEHGKRNQIEGELEEGKEIIVVEDLITTGQSSLAACDALKDLSVKVVACISIFNYGFSKSADAFTNAKIPLYSLTEFITLVNMAVEIKYISQEEKKILLEWQRTGKWDDSKQK